MQDNVEAERAFWERQHQLDADRKKKDNPLSLYSTTELKAELRRRKGK